VADAVEFCLAGKEERHTTMRVKKEVILSAGTYQTPQILELSGEYRSAPSVNTDI
jgi:choline dehydrogenase-like flavoprotein